MIGVDRAAPFSAAEAATLAHIGYRLAARYYRRSLTDPTCLTGSEASALLAAGITILPVFEWLADPSKINGTEGVTDGAMALACAQNAGQPTGTPIAFAFDFDWTGDLLPQTVDYLNAVYSALGGSHPIWIYGAADLLIASIVWPAVTGRWQAYAPAWSQGRNATIQSVADIAQIANGVTIGGVSSEVDIDHVQTDTRELWHS